MKQQQGQCLVHIAVPLAGLLLGLMLWLHAKLDVRHTTQVASALQGSHMETFAEYGMTVSCPAPT